jgi:hypothetical protein
MKFDVIGRIENMNLPDGKTAILYCVYEAVSNSIHAIFDKFGDDAPRHGSVVIGIALDTDGFVTGLTIVDNGVGFTPQNLESFETSDSRFKYARGGKGVGRLIWIKVFSKIQVESVYEEDGATYWTKFDFEPSFDESIVSRITEERPDEQTGSIIRLSAVRPTHRERMRPVSFLRDLSLHFFPQFISGTMPQISFVYKGRMISLNEYIEDKIESPITEVVILPIEGVPHEFTIEHLFVEPTISKYLKNAYLLTAHGRLVGDPVSIEKLYGLRTLESGKAYVALVRGALLDQKVDQERLAFKLTFAQERDLAKGVLEAIERFLSDHIVRVRAEQRKTLITVLAEHPQLASQVGDIDEYIGGLYPGMDEEQIGQNLFVLLYREEREIREKMKTISLMDDLGLEVKKEAEELLEKVTDQAKHRLAELIVKRRQILKIANELLKYADENGEKYAYEKMIHELICPLGEMYTSKDYLKHNMWVLDDTLAYYGLFASDKSLKSLSDSDSTKEPDLIFFNPLGLRRKGTNDPVVIVEFKRPGDEKASRDPVDQVLEYIEKLMGKTIKAVDGQVISDINKATPFECIVVCDLTEGTRRMLERSIASSPTPDGQGYYGWARNHNATVRVISFQKMLHDAELRHKVFFTMLGLPDPA